MDLIRPVVSSFEKLISEIPFLVGLYSRPYREVIKNEIKLAGINDEDKVLNVGCGAVPFTAIHLLNITGAELWIQDRDSDALDRAKKCLKRSGLADRARFFEGDAAHDVPESFDVAIVALQAGPKKAILKNLMQKMTKGGRLVFRQPSKSFADYYDKLPEEIRSFDKIGQKTRTFDQSVLFLESPQLLEVL